MDSNRIKEIQQTTAYPDSTSVMVALNQVWNECEQENKHRIKELEGTIENMKAISLQKEELVNGITSVDYPSDNETNVHKVFDDLIQVEYAFCSKCYEQLNNVLKNENYCPNCGRKIKK